MITKKTAVTDCVKAGMATFMIQIIAKHKEELINAPCNG